MKDQKIVELIKSDESLVNKISSIKEQDLFHKDIAHLERRIRKKHIKRMNNGECTPLAGINFIDLITPCTRITDHALNLVEKVIEDQI